MLEEGRVMSLQIRDKLLTILVSYLEAKSNSETRGQVRDTLKAFMLC